MAQILAFPMPAPPVSTMRNRDEALSRLLPKFLGILWEHGAPGGLAGGASAQLGPHVQIGGSPIRPHLYCVHVYTIGEPGDMNPMNMRDVTKVFSAHLVAVGMGDPTDFRYWNGRCGILSWRRGPWEDAICDHAADPRTVAHLLAAGLTRYRR